MRSIEKASRALLVLAIFGSGLAGTAFAASPSRLHTNSPDLFPPSHARSSHMLMQASAASPLVSSAGVGDADSFGRNVVYAGIIGSEDVYLEEDCTGFPTGDPANQCIVLNPQPTTTSFDLSDVGHITLPANSTHSLLCFHTTTFQSWSFLNETASAGESNLRYQETATIESDLLSDPSLIDPTTGLPFNGKLTTNIGTNMEDGGTLQPGEDRHHEAWTTRTCQGGAISKASLSSLYGLPDSVVSKFFKKPITIRLNVSGNATLAQEALVILGVRFYGD